MATLERRPPEQTLYDLKGLTEEEVVYLAKVMHDTEHEGCERLFEVVEAVSERQRQLFRTHLLHVRLGA